MKHRVLIAPVPLKDIPHVYGPVLTAAGVEMVYPLRHAQMTEAEMLAELPGLRASLAGSEPYTRAVIAAAAAKGLKVIARSGVGYDAIDLAAATEHGVAVTFAPGTNQDAVAEHTFMLILALLKNLLTQHNGLKTGKWLRQANLPLRGKTLGVVGLGRIGKSVAVRGRAFGTTVVAYEPFPDQAFVRDHSVTLLSFEDLLRRRSDIVTLHLPMSADAKQMINKATIALMKPNVFLINTARGGLVNEPDLYEALKSKRIAGAGLDVFEDEPPGDNPLLALDNVLLTAHTAGVDLQSRDDMARVAAEAIARLLAGDWPAELVVNSEVKERFFSK